MKNKKRLLVVASTFPRWKNDTLPPFVYELSRRLTDKFEVYVLAPHFKGAKKYELMDDMHVFRFQYFPEDYENLVCSGGAIPTLKKNKLTYLQVPFFFMAELFSLLKLVRKIKPKIIAKIPANNKPIQNGNPFKTNKADVYAPIPKNAMCPILNIPVKPKEICNAIAKIK